MATTTPLNGWPVPTSTDYVKDGATAIESLGDAIDASVGSGLLAWTSYTPVLTPTSGSITSYVINSAKYAKIGKTVHLAIDTTITNNGTGSGQFNYTLPVNAKQINHGGGGIDATNGNSLSVFLVSATAVRVATYNYTYPGVTVRFSITYEAV
jgi:hypothetical protein